MQAFKFRSLRTFSFVADILVSQRLYCCKSEVLNDVREADYREGYWQGGREWDLFVQEVHAELSTLRICSLTATINNHLLWAHYADGYTGVAIEVDVNEQSITPVRYDDEPAALVTFWQCRGTRKRRAIAAARAILSRKYHEWKHEEELRLFSKSDYALLSDAPRRVIVGCRTQPSMVQELLVLFQERDIRLERMVVAVGHSSC